MQVITEITWSCPGKCSFCPLRKSSVFMTIEEFRKVLEVFRDVSNDPNMAVVISGGEPSVVSNLRDYVATAKSLGYLVTIVTNAFRPDNVVRSEPDLVEVSIDYYGSRHDKSRGIPGLFRKAVELVRMCVREGIPVVVRSTAMKDNIHDILKIKDYLRFNGYEVPVIAMPVRGVPNLRPSEYELNMLRNHGVEVSDNCPAGISSFVVTPNLEILPCIFYRKRIGQFIRFTREELEEAMREGAKLPRFPCEKEVFHKS